MRGVFSVDVQPTEFWTSFAIYAGFGLFILGVASAGFVILLRKARR